MTHGRGRIRLLLLGGVALAAALISLAAYAGDVFEQPELDTVDARFEIRGAETPPRDLVVVQVDDKTFNELQEQWPFPRSLHARLIDRLTAARAAAIGYDVQFSEPSEEAEDNALIDAAARSGRVVFAATEVADDGEPGVLGGREGLEASRARAGNTNFGADPGAVVRRVVYERDKLKSFAVATTEVATGKPVPRGEFPSDRAPIDYLGPPGTVRHVSFSDALRGRVPARTFAGATVVVGASAPTLQDLHPTPTSGDELMSGPEIQANSISTVARGLPLENSAGVLNVVVIVLLSFVAPLAGVRLGPLTAFGAAVAVGLLYLVIAQLTFGAGLILPVVVPLLALALGAVGTLAVHYITTAYERERVRDLFSRFVPDRVVDDVIERADGLRLGGEESECTVLFSDIRGFTTFSETRPPAEVIEVLNRYHSLMGEAIFGAGGTLVSYIGDGIIAVFGAPIHAPDHAERALAAAQAMLGPKLEEFNEWMREKGHSEGFRMGVGLNSGTVVAGNIGSERRVEYTLIGDTVNTASRLEGLTKGTPHQLFVAESTRELLGEGRDELRYVDELEVRGREGSVKVFSLREQVAEPAMPA